MRLYVLAGRFSEYRAFCERHALRLHDTRWVQAPEQILGTRGCPMVCVGTWRDLPRLADIEPLALMRFWIFAEGTP